MNQVIENINNPEPKFIFQDELIYWLKKNLKITPLLNLHTEENAHLLRSSIGVHTTVSLQSGDEHIYITSGNHQINMPDQLSRQGITHLMNDNLKMRERIDQLEQRLAVLVSIVQPHSNGSNTTTTSTVPR